MASPLFAATPVPFGKRSTILVTITADQLRGLQNQGFHGSLPDTARAVGRLCLPPAPTDSRDGGPMMPLPRPVLRYRLSAPRLAPTPRPTASLRNEQKHRGLRPAPRSGGAPARKLSLHLRPAAHLINVGSRSASGIFGEASRPPILVGPPRFRSPALIRRAAWEVKGKGAWPHLWRLAATCPAQ